MDKRQELSVYVDTTRDHLYVIRNTQSARTYATVGGSNVPFMLASPVVIVGIAITSQNATAIAITSCIAAIMLFVFWGIARESKHSFRVDYSGTRVLSFLRTARREPSEVDVLARAILEAVAQGEDIETSPTVNGVIDDYYDRQNSARREADARRAEALLHEASR